MKGCDRVSLFVASSPPTIAVLATCWLLAALNTEEEVGINSLLLAIAEEEGGRCDLGPPGWRPLPQVCLMSMGCLVRCQLPFGACLIPDLFSLPASAVLCFAGPYFPSCMGSSACDGGKAAPASHEC